MHAYITELYHIICTYLAALWTRAAFGSDVLHHHHQQFQFFRTKTDD
jgi:hypothetical protein